ncbi:MULTISPECIES: triphosphoribosyl-dephospho-CoA synthase MdcB [Burkholderiales]|uniref:Probable 2-(5''-triphosphoribosyl)-3'-dephosphocoenzyme-A synthase n=2 Tax=Burkholderiales TaxID=80840 RepID=Q6QHN0_ACHDE|nr:MULTISPECIES: triphosphoribosyl-dephospho-CoA synthase MdcB [Burkholderiales]AAK81664.1 MdcB [Burkholderia cepacia]AAS49454.1 CitG [Achromobacter denitrificans]
MKAALRVRAASGPLETAAGAQDIGRAAVFALHDELALWPKPGLVSFLDNGSHQDMDAHTFMRSLFALRHYFPAIFELGRGRVPFASLEACGIAAEKRMLAATVGINTHRGAVFSLGLLCAAAGAVESEGGRLHPATLRAALRRHWGAALAERAQRVPVLPGGIAARRYGLRSASEEAAQGFPVIFETAAPALERASAQGLTPQQARIDTLFAVMAVLDDSNLAHRGGLDGLHFAQAAARRFIDRGGIAAPNGLQHARAVHRDFVARRLSPGGAADALAAACWLQRICGTA